MGCETDDGREYIAANLTDFERDQRGGWSYSDEDPDDLGADCNPWAHEPPRESWRLQLLREWSHDQVDQVFP